METDLKAIVAKADVNTKFFHFVAKQILRMQVQAQELWGHD